MKRCLSIRTAVASAAMVLTCMQAAHAANAAHPGITVTVLPLSPDAAVSGLDNEGELTGSSRVDGHDTPFRTGPRGQGLMGIGGIDVGDATAINDDGVVVGNIGSTDFGSAMHAFMAARDASAATDLGTLGGDRSQATGISRTGQVVGWSTVDGGGVEHAFMTDVDGTGMRDIGHLGGTCAAANGVNDHGEAVGYACIAGDRNTHAFFTGQQGSAMQDLGTLGGPNSSALAVNAKGVVVGWSDTGKGLRHAFRTGPDGRHMFDLDPGKHQSVAIAVNARGHIVGFFQPSEGLQRAFIASVGHAKFTDLNNLVTLPHGAVLMGAVAINNHDQVVAFASDGNTYLLSHVFRDVEVHD